MADDATGLKALLSKMKRDEEAAEYQSQAIIGGGIAICGLPPKRQIACYTFRTCDHCKTKRRHIRVFSGSGWYEDYIHCLTCGEDWSFAYHPFKRGWRKRAIADARSSEQYVVPVAEFFRVTRESIRREMGWS